MDESVIEDIDEVNFQIDEKPNTQQLKSTALKRPSILQVSAFERIAKATDQTEIHFVTNMVGYGLGNNQNSIQFTDMTLNNYVVDQSCRDTSVYTTQRTEMTLIDGFEMDALVREQI